MDVALNTTRVRDIMPDQMVTISAGDTLSTVEDIMTLGHVRHMPVVRGGTLVGVVSERDLLRASLSKLSEFGEDERRAFLQGVEIARVMSAPPIVIDSESSVEEAARRHPLFFFHKGPSQNLVCGCDQDRKETFARL